MTGREQQLERVGKRYADAIRVATEETALLHDHIRQAHAEGMSLRAIAKATGVSHQRVHQIVGGKG